MICSSLPLREWILVFSSVNVILSVFLISSLFSNRVVEVSCEFTSHKPLRIDISGAVTRPGVYFFPQGVSYKRVLRKVKPEKGAQIVGVDLEDRVFESCSLLVSSPVKASSKKHKPHPS